MRPFSTGICGKMIEGDTTAWFVSEFKSMTNGAAEEFIKQAVSKAIQYVK